MDQVSKPAENIGDSVVAVARKTAQSDAGGAKRGTKAKKKKWIKRMLLIVGVLILVAASFLFYQSLQQEAPTVRYVDKNVERGDIFVNVSGPGTIEPSDKYDVVSAVTGEILEAPFVEEQMVTKGDVLFRIDPEEAQKNIDSLEILLDKAKLSYDQALAESRISYPSIKSDIAGIVKTLYVAEGDFVQLGTPIADITDSEHLLLTAPFNQGDPETFQEGDPAQVWIVRDGSSIQGTVQRVYEDVSVSATGAPVRYVEILIPKTGGIGMGDSASAIVNDCASNDIAQFTEAENKTLSARSSGRIGHLSVRQGERVEKDQQIADILMDGLDSIQLRIDAAALNIKEAEKNLENARKSLDNYVITSPITGKVLKKYFREGDKLDAANLRSSLALVADMASTKFSIQVDELDIGKVHPGQPVVVVADAMPGETFEGVVDSISQLGVAVNGVTTYDVQVLVPQKEDLRLGMNVNGSILVDSAKDVLRVPSVAVERGNYILLKLKPGQTEEQARKEHALPSGAVDTSVSTPAKSPPEGYIYIQVRTGLNDLTWLEITQGLSVDDTVAIEMTVAVDPSEFFSQYMETSGTTYNTEGIGA